jgi:pyruvate formate lyase activating enzyme
MNGIYQMNNTLTAFRKTSLVDYPGKVAAVIFFQGCNLRCPWCYNGELVLGTAQGLTPLEEAFAIIEKRRRVLGGVVLSGGEPTLQRDLPEVIARIKAIGLPVKLDTNGTLPAVLEALMGDPRARPDFIAMDVKLPPRRYVEIAANKQAGDDLARSIERSVALIRESGIPHEFRALRLPAPFFTDDDLASIVSIADDTLKVRDFRPGGCLDESWN